MTIRTWMDLLKDKNDHYPISDEFIGTHQQGKTGYMVYAMQVGHPIGKSKAEPNQKWHFFVSYLSRRLASKKFSLGDLAELRYNKLVCPELLLWIAEASGIDREIVKDAANMAKEMIDTGENGYARNKAGVAIRRKIPWEMLEASLTKR